MEDKAKIEKCKYSHPHSKIILSNIIALLTDGKMIRYESAKKESVSPVKNYNEKTYIGIYIGDLPIQILTSYKESTGQLINSTMNNPAIFVPELKKIIYGCESWWKTI